MTDRPPERDIEEPNPRPDRGGRPADPSLNGAATVYAAKARIFLIERIAAPCGTPALLSCARQRAPHSPAPAPGQGPRRRPA